MVDNLKIYVCTTFRDFKGTENDEIQKMFLKSLEYQTYKKFELVVTLFGEKKVESEVKRFNFESSFYFSNVKGSHRYSHTQVLLNAINRASLEDNNYLILWTSCDVIYENNFFKTIIENYRKNIMGTSHPHITYSTLLDFKNNNKRTEKKKLYSGFDLIYFDKYFLNDNIKSCIENYIFNDWGVFEHFLISLNELNKKVFMINLYEETKVYKIENDRNITSESNSFLNNSHKLNSITFNNFLKNSRISIEYFDLTYCHFKFKVKNIGRHYWNFRKCIFEYLKRKMRRILSKLVPSSIKYLIKGDIK